MLQIQQMIDATIAVDKSVTKNYTCLIPGIICTYSRHCITELLRHIIHRLIVQWYLRQTANKEAQVLIKRLFNAAYNHWLIQPLLERQIFSTAVRLSSAAGINI